jgi:hypothetical protein
MALKFKNRSYLFGLFFLTACSQEYDFSYKILDGDTEISRMPFGNNRDLVSGNKIDYKVINDSIYTSVYVGAHAGCRGTKIIPVVRSENQKLILSIALSKSWFADNCLLNVIQLNFKIKNKGYQEVFYLPTKSSLPN